MRRNLLFVLALLAAPASAQLPFLQKYPTNGPPPLPVQNSIDVLRSDFAAQSGGTSVYFAMGSSLLTAQATTMLVAQAMWLRQHPEVSVRIEGYGDQTDTRDHALALGARRAAVARDYLLLLGIPEAQVSTMTWGKERPGPPSVESTITIAAP